MLLFGVCVYDARSVQSPDLHRMDVGMGLLDLPVQHVLLVPEKRSLEKPEDLIRTTFQG